MKASSEYPQEKIRDSGLGPQDGPHADPDGLFAIQLCRAQPEDNIAVEDLIPGIGPYDIWATMWGYKPIPEAKTADAGTCDARHLGASAGRDAMVSVFDGRLGRWRNLVRKPKQ